MSELGTAQVIRANARNLPLADNSVDLVVTSPPYFALRSYQDGGEHYAGQIGDEPTPAEFVAALLEVTAECVRVLKPSGSLWVNLGDKYVSDNRGSGYSEKRKESKWAPPGDRGYVGRDVAPRKSLIGIPWRYAIRCIDDLGLILRAEVIWSKPNGLPESVTDRVRRSHETWFHFTKSPRYFSAVDEIREAHAPSSLARYAKQYNEANHNSGRRDQSGNIDYPDGMITANPLGKLPGSVWTVPTEPLRVPDHLGIDHFAAFPTEWPKRIIQGWSPAGVCVECGEGRRPVADADRSGVDYTLSELRATERVDATAGAVTGGTKRSTLGHQTTRTITGYACACPEPTAPTRPSVILDPFGGTGTTAMVAKALGRHGISVDMSADYCRLAGWRTTDPKQLAKAARRPFVPPAEQTEGQLDLLEGIA